MKVFKLLLVSITYLLIGVLELYGYFLFKTESNWSVCIHHSLGFYSNFYVRTR